MNLYKWEKKNLEELRAYADNLDCENDCLVIEIEELKKENKILKEKLSEITMVADDEKQSIEHILELEEENRNLKMVVDKLHNELEECECSFWFESDEVWFWKREYKRLKKWIKEHCKWYWNLFPEDEMKRQRKKAEKKRK